MIFLVVVTAHDFSGPQHAIIRCKDAQHQTRMHDALEATLYKYPHIEVKRYQAESMDVFEATCKRFFDDELLDAHRTHIV